MSSAHAEPVGRLACTVLTRWTPFKRNSPLCSPGKSQQLQRTAMYYTSSVVEVNNQRPPPKIKTLIDSQATKTDLCSKCYSTYPT